MAAPRRNEPNFSPPPLPSTLHPTQREQCASPIPITQCEVTIRTVLSKRHTIAIRSLPASPFSFRFLCLAAQRLWLTFPLQTASREQRHLCNRCCLYTLAHQRGLFLTLETTPARQGFSTAPWDTVKASEKPCRSCTGSPTLYLLQAIPNHALPPNLLCRAYSEPTRTLPRFPNQGVGCKYEPVRKAGAGSLCAAAEEEWAHPRATTLALYRYAIHCPHSPFLQTQLWRSLPIQ